MVITTKPIRPPLFTILLLSALGLAYEVLLMRLFSVIQWHHFAYMIVSIALLGYGASGAFLTVIQDWALRHFRSLFLANIFLFACSSWLCFIFGQLLPFNALELFWDKSQWLWLFLLYLLFLVPFFCVANCVALSFSCCKVHINLSFAADLGGAAIGAIGIVVLLGYLFPEKALSTLVSLAMLAALIAVLELGLSRRWLSVIAIVAIFPWLTPERWTTLHSSEFKPLNQTLNIIGSQVLQQRSSPLGLLTIVENDRIPFRYAPGLSMNATQTPPEQVAVFTDGDGMTVINRFDGNLENLRFLDHTTSALPYHLRQRPEVLILGAGGGSEILQALFHDSRKIDAVEINRQMLDLVAKNFSQYSGDIYTNEKVTVHIAEARAFVAASEKRYDLIQISLMDSFGSASAGLTSLNEDYLYTTDALKIYLKHLNPNGILAITRWLKIPPRDTLKLIATAKQALHDIGIFQADKHLAVIRAWNTATVLIANRPLTKRDIEKIKHFCEENSFDLVHYPGIVDNEANQFNILKEPFFYHGAKAILSAGSEKFLRDYKYDLTPSSDERPFFFHFSKLSALPEILKLPASQGLPLIEWGTIILYITLLQASLASVILIILPLWLYQRRHPEIKNTGHRTFVFSYFFLIGIAFMFIEMAFIQKFVLFLSHPLYAFAVVICAFLLFAGIGSSVSKKLPGKHAMKITGVGIVACSLLYLLLLQPIFNSLLSANEYIKVVVSFGLIAPLAFFMGMPFPLALSHLAEKTPHHIPWAWGVNGCASVISAVLATLLAIQFGFTVVILLALLLYVFAVLIFHQQYR